MADKTLYFLRHGEAESNAGGFYAGQSDVALTEKGIGQAKAAAPMLKNVKFDKIYCSDLQRAKRTAALALPDSECEYTALIREIDVGELSYQSIAECEKNTVSPIWMPVPSGIIPSLAAKAASSLRPAQVHFCTKSPPLRIPTRWAPFATAALCTRRHGWCLATSTALPCPITAPCACLFTRTVNGVCAVGT